MNKIKKILYTRILLLFAGFAYISYHTSTNTTNIEKIEFDASLLEQDGSFNEQSLPQFLAKAYSEKKIIHDDFSKEACLKAKKLNAQGSFNTVQLFLVTSTCKQGQASLYIIKEAKNGILEANNLKAIEDFPGMRELLAPKSPPKGLPSIALPIAYFSYSGAGGYGLHCIATMPAAKGKVLCEIVANFRDNQSPQNTEKIKRAYKILGNELANFHKRFSKPLQGSAIGKTIPHGDFHCFNVFYDEIGGHFTFIDNETMASSLNDLKSPDDDILKPFLGLFSTSETEERKNIIQGIDLKLWHNVALKHFIEGYLDAYNKTEQKQVLQNLKAIFNSNKSFAWLEITKDTLQKLRTEYINPVFDEIQKERFTH